MDACPQCGGETLPAFRFCPSCGAPQRTKLVEFFLPHPDIPADAPKSLRVSRYLGTGGFARQVRFSIWIDDTAEAAVSLDEGEAQRLAEFLAPHVARRGGLLHELRASFRL